MIRKLHTVLGLIAALAIPALASPALADTNVRIVVPAHDIARGDVIGDADLTFGMTPGSALMNGTITHLNDATGMEARRVLHAGEAFVASDVRHPIVVTKGQTITMTFDAPGVDLTAMGRALSEGGIGDTVTVQNPSSFRMIAAIVTGPGTVRATGPISNGSMPQRSAQLTALK